MDIFSYAIASPPASNANMYVFHAQATSRRLLKNRQKKLSPNPKDGKTEETRSKSSAVRIELQLIWPSPWAGEPGLPRCAPLGRKTTTLWHSDWVPWPLSYLDAAVGLQVLDTGSVQFQVIEVLWAGHLMLDEVVRKWLEQSERLDTSLMHQK